MKLIKFLFSNLIPFSMGIILTVFIFSLTGRFAGCRSSGHSDTVTVTTIKYDTIPADTIFVPAKGKAVTLVNERDTLVYDTMKVFIGLNKIRTYDRIFTDRWAEIKTRTTVHGYLLDSKVTYANLKPAILKTVILDRTVTNRIPQRGIFITAYVGLSDLKFQAQYLNRKGWVYGYQYSPINQTPQDRHMIGIGRRIL